MGKRIAWLGNMKDIIDGEVMKHLCSKGAWFLDENGNDMCLDSYGFSVKSERQIFELSNFETMEDVKNANLRCLKNRGKK